MSGCEPVPPTSPPDLGEHTETVLATELGLSREDIAQLKSIGAIAGPARNG
jgi:crotonobetainyl-CoA:carnitine CoA-transferase CaiB-like acyl-CoA transferase